MITFHFVTRKVTRPYLKEGNASLQKLLNGKEKSEDTDDADADRQHDTYVSAMLPRRHKTHHRLCMIPGHCRVT